MSDAEILRAAAAVYERRGDRSEPGQHVPAWLRLCAHLCELEDTPVSEEQAARNAAYDEARRALGEQA